MAAEVLELEPFSIADLVDELNIPETGITFVEGAGGPRSPLADDGDSADLAEAIGADTILLVADPGLGTINAVQLSRDAFGESDVIVFLNRYDARSDLHVRNRRWLEEVAGLFVVVDCEELIDRLAEEVG